MQQYTDCVINRGGAAVSGASVLVKTYPGGATATIYSDNGTTEATNPLTTDANGRFNFYAADGRYTLVISKTGVITAQTIEDILLQDPDDGTAEQDAADVSFQPVGSGAPATTVQDALSNLKAWISTDTVASRFYRYDATFNATVDPGTFIGYNLTGFGQIEDASKGAIMFGMEANYNDGSKRSMEFHMNMAGPSQSFVRPFTAIYDLTGSNANKISSVQIYSQVDIDILCADGNFQIDASSVTTDGTWEHTGTFLTTSSIFQSNNGTDSSSAIQIGAGDNAAGSRTNVRWRNGGFAAPSDVNTTSNGDKSVFWNSSTVKVADGINDNGIRWWQINGSAASSFLWYGGTSDTPAQHLALESSGNLVVGPLAATATNATAGFLYVPSCAGTPNGTPTAKTGKVPIVVDSTNHKLYFYSGGAWRDAGP